MKRKTIVIEMGVASRRTKGDVGPGFDIKNSLAMTGLADD
jgi:hypothetical protein